MKIFNTHNELVQAAPKDRPFQVWVDSNPYGDGSKKLLWANIDGRDLLCTFFYNQSDINGVDYEGLTPWRDDYTGTFTLVDPFEEIKYQKPQVLPVGTKVEILESARECGDYEYWDQDKKDMIGNHYTIIYVHDHSEGLFYETDTYTFPHYCVRPVTEKERTLEDVLAGLSDQDKEIISKVINK